MARKIGLGGRGINALLDNNKNDNSDDEQSGFVNVTSDTDISEPVSAPAAAVSVKSKSGDIVQLPVDKLVPNPGQPRKNFDEADLQELSDSIKTFGILQPIIAADTGGGSYIIVAGERRTRAARLAGLETVPVIIRDYTERKRLEVSMIENIQRSDLNPIEEAAGYKNLMDFSSLSQDEVAARMGKNRSTVANALRLLKLPVEVQKSIEEGKVSPGHARAMLSVNDKKARDKLYRELLAGDISVRQAEKRAAALNNAAEKEKTTVKKGASKAAGSNISPDIEAITDKIRDKLGTKIVIEGNMDKGCVRIEYYSMDDLKRIFDIIDGVK